MMATMIPPIIGTPASYELEDALLLEDTIYPKDQIVLMIDANGLIRQCNKTAGKFMGCPTSKLVWQHISSLLPQLGNMNLLADGQLNPRLRYLSRIGHHFQLDISDDIPHSACIFVHELESAGRYYLRLIICPDKGALQH